MLIILALLGVALFFLLRRRKQKASDPHSTLEPATAANNTYADTKPELAGTSVVGNNYGNELDGNGKPMAEAPADYNTAAGGYPTTSPSHYAEMAAVGGAFHPSHDTYSGMQQHNELPSYAPGGQPYTHIAGGEMEAAQGVPAAQTAYVAPEQQQQHHYVENTGPYYPEAYARPPSPRQIQASRLAALEASQRELEDRMSRMRQLSAMEQEHARIQDEIGRLRHNQ